MIVFRKDFILHSKCITFFFTEPIEYFGAVEMGSGSTNGYACRGIRPPPLRKRIAHRLYPEFAFLYRAKHHLLQTFPELPKHCRVAWVIRLICLETIGPLAHWGHTQCSQCPGSYRSTSAECRFTRYASKFPIMCGGQFL